MYDSELNKPLWQIALQNASIREQWEKELGDYMRRNYLSKDLYSNNLRHQYAAAITARNLGADKARFLGNMQEIVNSSGGDKLDGRIDKINNEIGIQYGLNNPTMPKNQLFDLLVKDHTKNLNYRNQQLAGE
jgi:hypothetical protein